MCVLVAVCPQPVLGKWKDWEDFTTMAHHTSESAKEAIAADKERAVHLQGTHHELLMNRIQGMSAV